MPNWGELSILGAFNDARNLSMKEGAQDLQNVSNIQGILSKQREEQQFQVLKGALSQSQGDPEKAMRMSLESGDPRTAALLVPMVELQQKERTRKETQKALSDIYGFKPPPPNTPQQPSIAQPVMTQPVMTQPGAEQTGAEQTVMPQIGAQPPGTQPPGTPQTDQRNARISQLEKMSILYSGNAAAVTAIQREIDRLRAELKPTIVHDYAVSHPSGEPYVQPHILRYDPEGNPSARPVPGSQPSPKFAKQVGTTVTSSVPVTALTVQDTTSPTGWSYIDGRTKLLIRKGAPQPPGDPIRAYGTTTAQVAAKDDNEQHATAVAAADGLIKINEIVNIIKTSNAITGMAADIKKNIERVKVLVLNDKKAGKIVSDTEYLDAAMGAEVFSMIKPLGIGARGLDTPAEKEFLRKVLTGEISLNKETLLKMATMRQQLSQRSVDRWNTRVESGELDPYFLATGRKKSKISSTAKSTTPDQNIEKFYKK